MSGRVVMSQSFANLIPLVPIPPHDLSSTGVSTVLNPLIYISSLSFSTAASNEIVFVFSSQVPKVALRFSMPPTFLSARAGVYPDSALPRTKTAEQKTSLSPLIYSRISCKVRAK